jgi:hypothetical protein
LAAIRLSQHIAGAWLMAKQLYDVQSRSRRAFLGRLLAILYPERGSEVSEAMHLLEVQVNTMALTRLTSAG